MKNDGKSKAMVLLLTGEGYEAKDFTWAGLVLDMIRMEKRKMKEKGQEPKSEKANGLI